MRYHILYYIGLIIILFPLLYASAKPFSIGYSMTMALLFCAVGAVFVAVSLISQYKNKHK